MWDSSEHVTLERENIVMKMELSRQSSCGIYPLSHQGTGEFTQTVSDAEITELKIRQNNVARLTHFQQHDVNTPFATSRLY